MRNLTSERLHLDTSESSGEILFRRQLRLARAVLPHVANEAADAPFIEVEDALVQLNLEAFEQLSERKKPTRKLRRTLSRYAHRLLEITDQEPDLLDTNSLALLGQSYDVTGERDILENTLEQARYAGFSTDTNINLRAIEAALELDKPFSEVMGMLNRAAIPFFEDIDGAHVSLSADYEDIFAPDANRPIRRVNRSDVPTDEHGNPITVEQAFFKK